MRLKAEVKPSLQKLLNQEEIGSDRLLIIVGQSHPWFNREKVDLTELKNTDWVMREPGLATQQRLE